eukprot:g128.t1
MATRCIWCVLAMLGAAAALPTKIVNISASVTLPADPIAANPLLMGCHSDSGYMAQPFGMESQMVWGESFEGNWSRGHYVPKIKSMNPNTTWNWLHDGDAAFTTDPTAPFHGLASQRIELHSGTFAFVTNRGLGNQGLVFHAEKDYTGYIFARSDVPVELTVAMHNTGTAATRSRELLASTSVQVVGGSQWRRYNFSLTPNASTSCATIPFGSDPHILCSDGSDGSDRVGSDRVGSDIPDNTRHSWQPEPGDACQRCGGEVAFGLTRAGDTVNVDFAALHPGEWGRFAGLEVRRDGVELLQSMGVTAIRQGGSFSDPAMYSWKNWRGRKEERASFGAFWEHSYESSWGPFDFIDMCNAAGILPIVTTAAEATISGHPEASRNGGPDLPTICCSPEDMGDLVEYAWGDESTTWGKQRIADGHPKPYNVTWFELGNEQKNSRFVDQVREMEARAAKVGVAHKLHYLWPDTHYIGEDLNQTKLARAKALGLQDRLLMDVHTGPTGGVPLAQAFFANATQSDGGAGVMNLETNACNHGMIRALTEAIDLNAFLTYYPPSTGGGSAGPDGLSRMKGRMGSFCMEASGHADSRCTQGLAFFSAEQMWLQPGGWVHKMYHDAWQPLTAEVALSGQEQLPINECDLLGSKCQPRWMDTTPAARPGFCCKASVSAAFSADRSQLSLRFVNPSNTTSVLFSVASVLSLASGSGSGSPGSAAAWTLLNVTQMAHGDLADANPPNDTMRISPTAAQLHGSTSFVAPPQSVSVARLVA